MYAIIRRNILTGREQTFIATHVEPAGPGRLLVRFSDGNFILEDYYPTEPGRLVSRCLIFQERLARLREA